MRKVPITIHSPCVTTPDKHEHVRPGDQIRWRADHAEIFLLKLPGGLFVDEPDPFEVPVYGTNWTAYYEVAGNPGHLAKNYICGLSGNCLLMTADGPPDIIIDSSPHPLPKKRVKKKG